MDILSIIVLSLALVFAVWVGFSYLFMVRILTIFEMIEQWQSVVDKQLPHPTGETIAEKLALNKAKGKAESRERYPVDPRKYSQN